MRSIHTSRLDPMKRCETNMCYPTLHQSRSRRPSQCSETPKANISVAVINARSVRNKTTTITECITDHNIDILAITNISVAVINARSVRNKTTTITECITDHNIDILAITETWLKKNSDKPIIAAMTPSGYSFVNAPRDSGRGGGVGVIHRDELSCKQLPHLR